MRDSALGWEHAAIGMVDPVGDAGIGGFTHELANGLAAHGARVDVYTTRAPFAAALPDRRYRLIPLFGDASRSLADRIRTPCVAAPPPAAVPATESALVPYFDLLDRRAAESARLTARAMPTGPAPARARLAHRENPEELARLLSEKRYDFVWTQWPELGFGPSSFVDACTGHGIPLVHTVHNVVPHERYAGDIAELESVYAAAEALVVHSRAAARALRTMCPGSADRIVVSHHGLYSIYPRRQAARSLVRARLGLTEESRAVLFFGGVRPYKNLDGVLDAMVERHDPRLRLVVAGWEWGYGQHFDSLARTRAAVHARGLERDVCLLPGPFGIPQTAELFEAADAVVLPYLEGYGSGVLLMAMTFGKHVIVSPAGGMHEYLDTYPDHTKLSGSGTPEIKEAFDALGCRAPNIDASNIGHLTWSAIASRLRPALAARLEAAGSTAHA